MAIDRVSMFAHHQVGREPPSVRERMSVILVALREGQFVESSKPFRPTRARWAQS
jgi:hypothetical protein